MTSHPATIIPGVDQTDGRRCYWAFISHSHRDEAWARRLLAGLEGYRVPRRLVGQTSSHGTPVPARIFPVFRDLDELASSSNLDGELRSCLDHSHVLLIVCSPNAAASHWVNEEVRYFKKLGRENKILALIVDGEPHASNRPDLGLPECFPKALRISEDGRPPLEPLAADVRPGKGLPWRLAKLKLVAGLIGVNFDELRQRDQERRQKHRLLLAMLGILLLAAFAVLRVHTQREERLVSARESALRAGRHVADHHLIHARRDLLDAIDRGIDPAQVRQLAIAVLPGLSTQLDTLPFDTRRIESLAYSPDGSLLCSAGDDGRLWLWDVTQRYALLKKRQRVSKRSVAGAAFDPVRPRIAAAMWDGNLCLWDYQSPDPPQIISGHLHKIRVNAVDFHPKGTLLVSGSDDTFVKLWDCDSPRLALVGTDLTEHADFVKDTRFSPDGALVASACFDGIVRVHHVATRQPLPVDFKTRDKLNRVLLASEQVMICAGMDRIIRIVSLPDMKVLRTIDRAHSSRINALTLHPDGATFFSAADDGYVRRWSLPEGKLVQSIELHGPFRPDPETRAVTILSLAVSPDGKRLATGGDDGIIKIWDLQMSKVPDTPEAVMTALRNWQP